ncbi:chorismate mutase [Ligilactobacillus murinus]|uniref:Chorismate mutase domain-containing protein n=1 Tax=Ligilactobacillus murinus TaxID=1622 RepID=A0AAD0L1A0_9LACO|nr:chorismate mutase [Ligilactobacillus murinus]AWZ39074.1 hypothetical protein CPS94_09135 [Ligilactobacillus murinus]AWZ40045.1 hypothetical protein CPQ89_02805 [Ligilactobacillus murinus]
MKKEIEDFRSQINKVDEALFQELIMRFDIVQEINQYKEVRDIPVESKMRESILLERANQLLEDTEFKEYIINVYIEIIKQSKKYQKNNRG